VLRPQPPGSFPVLRADSLPVDLGKGARIECEVDVPGLAGQMDAGETARARLESIIGAGGEVEPTHHPRETAGILDVARR